MIQRLLQGGLSLPIFFQKAAASSNLRNVTFWIYVAIVRHKIFNNTEKMVKAIDNENQIKYYKHQGSDMYVVFIQLFVHNYFALFQLKVCKNNSYLLKRVWGMA